MEEGRMTIFEHLEELRQRSFKVLWALMISFLFFFSFAIRFVEVGVLLIPYPWPDIFDAVSVELVRTMMTAYLPEPVQAVQLSPAEAILVQIKVSLFLALLVSMPILVYQAARFLAPGLYPHEKRIIAKITIPATLLFLLGVLLAHFLIVPFMFEVLYGIGIRMGLTPLAGPDQVFDIVLLLFVGMGIAFQTPVAMWGLTALGVVQPDFWKKYWRFAVVGFFFFAAIITPDASGITMMLVAAPMTALYGVGYLLADKTWRERHGPPREGRRWNRSAVTAWSLAIVLVVAATGGFVYLGMPLLQPPVLVVEEPVAAGTWEVELPAFVLFAPEPLADMRSGATLRAANATTVAFTWSAAASDGTPVTFQTGEGEDAATLEVSPSGWLSETARSLTLTVADGEAGVYVLQGTVTYELVLRTEFRDANRNGVLDGEDAVLDRTLVFRYDLARDGAALQEAGATGVTSPSDEDRVLLDQGTFHALGPGWELRTSLRDAGMANATFAHTTPVAELEVEGLEVRFSLTRLFAWSPAEDLQVWVEGQSSTAFAYTWYVDLRFGALYLILQEP